MNFGRDPRERQAQQINEAFKRQQRDIAALGREIARLDNQMHALSRSFPVRNPVNDAYEKYRAHEQQYANTILLLGYGGFFALWASTAEKMPPSWFGVCGLLMGISLLCFIGFEIAKTTAASTALRVEGKTGPDGRKLTAGDALDLANARIERVNRAWPFVFIAAVSTGLVAGFLVLWFFVASVGRGEWKYQQVATENSITPAAPARPVVAASHEVSTAKPSTSTNSKAN